MTGGPQDQAPAADGRSFLRVRPGIFRRRIRILGEPGAVRVDVEDDAHCFGLSLEHDGTQATVVRGDALRTPWTLCGGALDKLERIVGVALQPRPTAVYEYTRSTEQCTHLFDLAALAVAHAARGTRRCQYDAVVPVRDMQAPRWLRLYRDGQLVMAWLIQGRTDILGPGQFTGTDTRSVLHWAAEQRLDDEDFEAVFVMRRAWLVSGSRDFDLDTCPVAGAVPRARMGACHVYQHGVAEHAARLVGNTLDFTEAPERLLQHLDDPQLLIRAGSEESI